MLNQDMNPEDEYLAEVKAFLARRGKPDSIKSRLRKIEKYLDSIFQTSDLR